MANMPTASDYFPPSSIEEALEPIGVLPEEEFDALASAIRGQNSFSLTSDEIDVATQRIPSLAGILPYTLQALNHLYGPIAQIEKAGGDVPGAVRDITDRLLSEEAQGNQPLLNRLTVLLTPLDSHKQYRKIQRLKRGFIPHARGFSTLVDIRPDFSENEENIVGYVQVIQMRITTDDEDSKPIVFQLDNLSIPELRKAIDRLERKLLAVQSAPLLGQIEK